MAVSLSIVKEWFSFTRSSKKDFLFDILCIAIFLVFFGAFMAVFGLPILVIHLKHKFEKS